MKVIISSSKTMQEIKGVSYTIPLLTSVAKAILDELKTYNYEQLKQLYKTSDKLTSYYYQMLQNSNLDNNLSMAIKAYDGVVFRQFNEDLSIEDINYLDKHLYILSALYGLLRCRDGIINYRLDMADDFKISNMNLYDYYGEKIANLIDDDIIVNLASSEYSKCISKYKHVLDIDFLQDGKHHSTQLKKARGLMIKYMLDKRISDVELLKQFDYDNYHFDESLSDDILWIFVK